MNYDNVMVIHQTDGVKAYYYNGLRNNGIKISLSAMRHADPQALPCIRIHCIPKLNDQKTGENIIKALFAFIEQDFCKLNIDYTLPLNFKYWCIDKNGDLACYTRDLELYMYLCDPQNYPSSLLETYIAPLRPRHLPWQRTVTLKFVPNYITLEEMRTKLSCYVTSIFNLEEVYRTQTNICRDLRLELISKAEYDELVNDREVMINGHLIEIVAFFAPIRLLICSKCNEPGHFKRYCYSDYEVCRRCGEDRTIGDHQNCPVCCHRCGQEHLSTNYRCSFLAEYRRALRFYLRQQANFQVSINHNTSTENQLQQSPFNINDHAWPSLVKVPLHYYIHQSSKQSIRKKEKRTRNKTTKLQEKLDIKTENNHSKHQDDNQC